MVDARRRRIDVHRLRPEGNTEPGIADHQEIVRAIAHCGFVMGEFNPPAQLA